MREPVLLSWSGGKDSAMALEVLKEDQRYEVVALLCTVSEEYRRISHHGVREALLDEQAAALALDLDKLYLPSDHGLPCTNDRYEELMGRTLAAWRRRGVRLVAHGDLFLEDLRAYRDRNLASIGMAGLYPLWKRDTRKLSEYFIDKGFRAILSCVDGAKLGPGFAGRAYDRELLADLPESLDPCGEYGEFHTFVYDGPNFARPVGVRVGRAVTRENRHYVDLLPEGDSAEDGAMPPVFRSSSPP